MPSEGSPEAFHHRVSELSGAVDPGYSIAYAACDRWTGTGREAMIDLSGNRPRTWTFAQVRDQSTRLAHGFASLGVEYGSRVAVLLPQSATAAVTHMAIYRLGAIALPLSTMYGHEALAHRLGDAAPIVGVTDVATWERLSSTDFPEVCTWVVTDGDDDTSVPRDVTSLVHLIEGGRTAPVPDPGIGADTPAMIVYTSGTTGQPKGAVHGHRVVAAHAGPVTLAHNEFPRPGDRLWSPADWAWAGGLVDCLLSAWHAGVPIVAWRGHGFDPDQVLAVMAEYGVRNTFLPPTALRMLLQAGSGTATPSVDLRSVMTGGEPITTDIIEGSHRKFGVVPNAVYGQTEASMVVGSSSGLLPVRPGALGMTYPGYTTQLFDSEGHPADMGEVAVRADAPGVFLGYWQRPEATSRKVHEGWLMTGDLARRDEDGYLWFVSRADDIILSSGFRIGPAEIEASLERDPRVRGAAAIGVPDPVRGEVVRAIVELGHPVEDTAELERELGARVRRELAPYEVPRQYEFVDELPRTETGKVSRAALRVSAGAGTTKAAQ